MKERETCYSKLAALTLDVLQRGKATGAWPPDDDWFDDAQLILEMVELLDTYRRAGRVMQDMCELSPHVVRLMRDFDRQLPGVIARWYAWAERSGYIESDPRVAA